LSQPPHFVGPLPDGHPRSAESEWSLRLFSWFLFHARRRTNTPLERSPPKAEALRRRAPDRCQFRFAPQANGPASLFTAAGGRFSPRYPSFHAPDSTGSFAVEWKLAGLGRHGRDATRLYGEHRASIVGCFPQRGLDYAARPSLVLSRMIQSAFGVLDSARGLAGSGVCLWGKTASLQRKERPRTKRRVLAFTRFDACKMVRRRLNYAAIQGEFTNHSGRPESRRSSGTGARSNQPSSSLAMLTAAPPNSTTDVTNARVWKI